MKRGPASSRATTLLVTTTLSVLPLLAVSCAGDEAKPATLPPGDASPGEPAEVTFPPSSAPLASGPRASFLWGSASAGFQVEKGLSNTDWGLWVKSAGKIKGGDDPDNGGADALAHIDDDVGRLVATGQNAYRFSVEWARIYPTKAAFDADQPDAAAIASYDKLFGALRAAKIAPMVTLQHFAIPDYFADPRRPDEPQGWERPEIVEAFGKWCGRVAARWGGEVDWWATINEPMVTPIASYLQGSFPPGLVLAIERGLAAGKNEVLAHARCYDAVKSADTKDADGDGKPSMIGIVQHMRAVEPEEPNDAEDVAAAERVRYLNNLWFLNAVTRGDWDDDFDMKLDGPKDRKADPSLANKNDYLGVNYYTTVTASASRGFKLPIVNAAIRQDHIPNDRPKTDFYWDIHPKGFRIVIDEARTYGLPLVVTENGIADAKDTNRARFLLEHLYEVGKAKADGVDIRGYFYWSLLDNFEWASGFCPRFGLYSVDRKTAARGERPSARIYEHVARTGKITKAEIDAQPPYGVPTYCD